MIARGRCRSVRVAAGHRSHDGNVSTYGRIEIKRRIRAPRTDRVLDGLLEGFHEGQHHLVAGQSRERHVECEVRVQPLVWPCRHTEPLNPRLEIGDIGIACVRGGERRDVGFQRTPELDRFGSPLSVVFTAIWISSRIGSDVIGRTVVGFP